MKLNVGVIFGGKSLEHEMSIISAIQAMNNSNVSIELSFSNNIAFTVHSIVLLTAAQTISLPNSSYPACPLKVIFFKISSSNNYLLSMYNKHL